MKAMFGNFLAIVSLVIFTGSLHAQNVVVVMSSNAKVYEEALEGFREVVRHRIVGVQTLKNNPAEQQGELKKLRSMLEPDLVFVIGTPALRTISQEITNIPIVHAMVFNPLGNVPSARKNVVGISMIPSTTQVASLVRELNPKYRRVGTMLDPSRSATLLRQARMDFEQAGFQLIAREIRSVGEVGGALKSLEKEIDILWLWPDEAYLADDILQRIFLFSFDRKIPVLGLSERHTQMGALLSLSYGSAKDMGRQAGHAVNNLLGELRAAQMSTVAPRRIGLTVNLKTARKLELELADRLVQQADNAVKAPVYQEGDWWVFQIKTTDSNSSGKTRVEEHRVVFKNGKFETDDPAFLTGGDVSGTPSFLPFASLYISDPGRKWLDFPILPGKRWSFRYHRANLVGRHYNTRTGYASAEVIGELPDLIQTPAGRFKAIQINRTDTLNGVGYLTYFYSPQTKSVIKLKAEAITSVISPPSRRLYELELMAYGNDATGNFNSR